MMIFNKEFGKRLWCVLKESFSGFSNDNGLKLSASLAYYTVFSIAPLLILIISLTTFILRTDAFNDSLYHQIKSFVGADAAIQIQDTIKKLEFSGKTGIALIVSIITLLIGASSIFIEIQDSLNIIWRVKAKPKKGWLKLLQNRFLSFSLIVSLGFLLLVSLVINIILKSLSEKLLHFLPDVTLVIMGAVNVAVTLIVIATLFGIIFKVLPDVKIRWKDVRSGAIFTALLFMLGQYIIGLYLTYSAQASAYGAAGSIIVILIWIYYTAAILYIGAEFTQVYAEAIGSRIEPAEYAVHVEQKEIEEVVDKLPPQHPDIQGKMKNISVIKKKTPSS
jgi:membrane protein